VFPFEASCLNCDLILKSVAFLATKYNEVLLGYQLGQVVEQWKNLCFKEHPQGGYDICISTLRMRTEMVFEKLVLSLLNHLTRLIAWENFITWLNLYTTAVY